MIVLRWGRSAYEDDASWSAERRGLEALGCEDNGLVARHIGLRTENVHLLGHGGAWNHLEADGVRA